MEGRTALLISNNFHLAGDGECFNAMVGITRSKVICIGMAANVSSLLAIAREQWSAS